MSKSKKIAAIILGIIILICVIYVLLAVLSYDNKRETVYGVTFSKQFAEHLGLDWKDTYTAMLRDLNVKYIRIPTYWEDIEPNQDEYNFVDIDWQLEHARLNNVKVILVLGRRQPRWPECHDPVWVKNLSPPAQREKVLNNIELVINRYKNNPAIEIWQVENEPFLDFFGECPKIKKSELTEEIVLVKALDDRPVLITDSGELSAWYPTIKVGDLFGTTLYRITYNKYIGYMRYFFIMPSYYRIKAFVWGRNLETAFVAELQAEPWFPDGPLKMPIDQHYKTMNANLLQEHAEYARKTNFGRVYFWGIEWWYWLKVKHGDNSLWEAAKQYF